jgi:myosin heavy subunit
MIKDHGNNKNPYFYTHKIKKELFILKHTAKDVEYNVKSGFRDKNKDEIDETLNNVLLNS